MPQSYAEEIELTNYLWRNYQHLVEKDELVAYFAAYGKGPGKTGTPEIDLLLKDGVDKLRQRAAGKIMLKFKDEVVITRCLKCSCIVRTPQAQQCLWCGHDWHSSSAGKR
jgi:hypothetical protein